MGAVKVTTASERYAPGSEKARESASQPEGQVDGHDGCEWKLVEKLAGCLCKSADRGFEAGAEDGVNEKMRVATEIGDRLMIELGRVGDFDGRSG